MRNTWEIGSLDGIQKRVVSESPLGISISGIPPVFFICKHSVYALTQLLICLTSLVN